ncbi:hypothetical protein DFH07DRAFT_1057285 [Mycena maculata]|uniref:Homeobox domain-containing protein n=1 Tax=Mycena maculata TaxID=230809 RepID=A0AAD7K007_9AGAR|nr:hypothetical protein DFH07DRAFT_1057285 [Mycena maculata]
MRSSSVSVVTPILTTVKCQACRFWSPSECVGNPREFICELCSPIAQPSNGTLTTPHQSAVLHALLAQGRLPTTAMREEVGRAIGMSAREVETWFQNQRQRARTHDSDDSDIRSTAATVGDYEPGLYQTTESSDPNTSHQQKRLGCGAAATPEWRWGPLGPRTLCNACGLVYAKLIKRRMCQDF